MLLAQLKDHSLGVHTLLRESYRRCKKMQGAITKLEQWACDMHAMLLELMREQLQKARRT